MEGLARSCGSAVQVGPTYFEIKMGAPGETNVPGIAGVSVERASRNILFGPRRKEIRNARSCGPRLAPLVLSTRWWRLRKWPIKCRERTPWSGPLGYKTTNL